MSYSTFSIGELGLKMRQGALTSVALTRWTLDEIEAANPVLHAFIRPTPERALAAAQQADEDFAAGIDRGPMQGIPYGIKDLFDMEGVLTTCHSAVVGTADAEADAEIIRRLGAAGAVPVGKTATFEHATYGPDSQLPFPLARNPWNLDRLTGGSSSGSAVAIAAGLLRMSLGTDTGGSIRTPSSWCGTVGIKATFGRVSRRGCFPLSWSLDHTGPLARTVEDAALSLQAMAGYDPQDPYSADVETADYTSLINQPLAGLRIGIARRFAELASDDVRAGIEKAADLLRSQGAQVLDVDTPPLGQFGAVVRATLIIEGHHIHEANLRRRLSDFGPLMARRIALGASYSAIDYLASQKLRRMLADKMSEALCACDVILCPTTLGSAPPCSAELNPFDPAGPSVTNPANVIGNPAMSVPVGLDPSGMPISVQLIGRLFDEARLIQTAHAIEKTSGWLDIPQPDWRTAAKKGELA